MSCDNEAVKFCPATTACLTNRAYWFNVDTGLNDTVCHAGIAVPPCTRKPAVAEDEMVSLRSAFSGATVFLTGERHSIFFQKDYALKH